MPWKMEGENIAVKDGHPVWVYDDGKESPFDAGSALNSIKTVTAESVSRKNKLKEAAESLAVLEGIDDPIKFMKNAKEAIETVSNLKDKDFVAAGEVEKLKKGVADAYETQITEMKKAFDTDITDRDGKLSSSQQTVRNLLIKGAFDRSEFITKNTVLSPSIAFDTFGGMFDIEEIDGEVQAVGKRKNGEKIFSLRNAGSYAAPDECIEILVSEHPDKDTILKGTPGGGGAGNSNGGGGSGSISRSAFDNLTPIAQSDFVRKGGLVTE